MLKSFAFWIVLLCLGGCTVIRITGESGDVEVRNRFGIAEIHLDPKTKPILTEAHCLGYMSGLLGHSLGFTKWNIAAFDGDCRMILWVENSEQLEVLKELVGDLEHVCITSQDKGGT
jgi:hypothetical protein